MGQNWERAAMIKARPVAGDLALGAGFLEAIRPFVWRRGLDFAAVADIHAMKRRIDEHKGGALGEARDPVARIAGHNVKLGQGGIREIEFLAQTLQLVWGGRDPGLRVPTTLGALRLLARAGHVPRRAARRTGRRLPLSASASSTAADGGGPADSRAAASVPPSWHASPASWAIRTPPPSPALLGHLPACGRVMPRCSSWCPIC